MNEELTRSGALGDPGAERRRRARAFGVAVLVLGVVMLATAAWAYAVAPDGATIRLPTRGASPGRVGLGALFLYPVLTMLLGVAGILAPQKGARKGSVAWLMIAAAILALFQVVFVIAALNG